MNELLRGNFVMIAMIVIMSFEDIKILLHNG